jgi:hypothetical protein
VKRRLAQFGLALGLLLCVTVVVVYWRGLTIADVWSLHWRRDAARDRFTLFSSRDFCAVTWARERPAQRYPSQPVWELLHFPSDARMNNFVDLYGAYASPSRFDVRHVTEPGPWGPGDGGSVMTTTTVAAPTWFVASASAALTLGTAMPLVRARRRRGERRRRARQGLCLACGYDVCGADHDRCPGCGASTEPQPI